MNELQRGWVAGIIEGEGAIVVHFTKAKGAKYPIAQVTVRMTDEDVIETLSRVTDMGTKRGPYGPHEGSNKQFWVWAVSRQDQVVDLLEDLIPLLGQRRQGQALKALATVRESIRTPNARRSNAQGKEVTCETCSTDFWISPSRMRFNTRYCSRQCRNEAAA